MKIILLCLLIINIFNNVYTQFNNNYQQAVINNLNYYNKVQNTNRNRETFNYKQFENSENQYNMQQQNSLNSNQRKRQSLYYYPTLQYSSNQKPFVITEIALNQRNNNIPAIEYNKNAVQQPIAIPPQRSSASANLLSSQKYSIDELPSITSRFSTDEDNFENKYVKAPETFQYQFSKGWSVHEAINLNNIELPHLEDHKYLKYSKPNAPGDQYYQQFYNIYNYIEYQGKQDLNQYEMDSINDDFNGRSIVAPGQYPHMAAIGFLSNEEKIEFKCGGSLISKIYVVTAAHCCYLSGETPIIVKLGIINLKDQIGNTNPQRRAIKEIIVHPSYNSTINYHDIALLKLQTPVEITKFVRPILLWTSDHIPYERVFTMGYGSTSFAKAPTNILTELSLSIIPLDKCKKALPPDERIPNGIVDTQICGRDLEKNRDTCQGDSGGPLQLNLEHRKENNITYRYYLVGIISYGEFCGSKNPGVYTRVSSYSKWIASVVWPNYIKGS